MIAYAEGGEPVATIEQAGGRWSWRVEVTYTPAPFEAGDNRVPFRPLPRTYASRLVLTGRRRAEHVARVLLVRCLREHRYTGETHTVDLSPVSRPSRRVTPKPSTPPPSPRDA